MGKQCDYTAKVKLVRNDTHTKEWDDEGPADKVLMNAMIYGGNKDSKNVISRMLDYLTNDARAFDDMMTEILFRKKSRRLSRCLKKS